MPDPSRTWQIFSAWCGVAAWVAIIVAATIPWTDFVGHTHWQKVQWLPFVTPPVDPIDIGGNILLYVPFGYGFIRACASRRRAWLAVAIAATLSVSLEWSQLYSHSRFPSVQDVLCNVLGSGLGVWWAASYRSRRLAAPRAQADRR